MNAIKLFKFKTKNSVQFMTLVVFFGTCMQTKKESDFSLNSLYMCICISEYYLKNFEKFLEDFKITFIGAKCLENGIDDLETFLILEKEDLMNILGVNLGDSLKCKNAQQKFKDLER